MPNSETRGKGKKWYFWVGLILLLYTVTGGAIAGFILSLITIPFSGDVAESLGNVTFFFLSMFTWPFGAIVEIAKSPIIGFGRLTGQIGLIVFGVWLMKKGSK